jgi:predicted XRE-type DNA-binding protein
MPSAKAASRPGHVTTGSVLEDLGFSPQEIREIEIKHDLWVPIRAEIESRKLTQAQLARALQIHQPDASLLFRGQIARFSITRLLQFAERLGLAVTFSVAPVARARTLRGAAKIPVRMTGPRRKESRPKVASRGKRHTAAA